MLPIERDHRIKSLKEWADWPALALLVLLGLSTWGVKSWSKSETGIQATAAQIIERALLVLDFAGISLFIFIKVAAWIRWLRHRKFTKMWNDDEVRKELKNLLNCDISALPAGTVHFCTKEDLDKVCRLDLEAFRDTVYGVEKAELRQRYLAWYNRNSRVFSLIEDPFKPGKVIGYSIIVPISEEGVRGYLAGDFKDRNTPASLVARDRSEAAGVLVFAIALRKAYSYMHSRADKGYSIYFQKRIREHALLIFSDAGCPDNDYPPLYAETEHDSLVRRMVSKFGFVDTHRLSADGYKILVLPKPFRRKANANESAQKLEPATPSN